MSYASLDNLLRLFWVTGIMSPDEVRALIAKMEQIETLELSLKQLAKIFAPPNG